MIVLRIQNDKGIGPYFTSRSIKSMLISNMQDAHNAEWSEDPTTYPPPNMDDGILRNPLITERHGFIHPAQLYNWFSDSEIVMLEENGFHVVQLDVEITAIGKKQVLYKEFSEN